MIKKIVCILVLLALISGAAFAQFSPHKYKSMDMLLGLDFGMGATYNAYNLSSFPWQKANYAAAVDFGLNYDVYLFPWLSLSTGVLGRTGVYFSLNAEMAEDNIDLTGIAKTPVSVTIPLSFHINIPYVNFLYIGAGAAINIPVYNWSVTELSVGDNKYTFGAKGGMFISTPIDFGFDLVKANKGGSRFILRFAPEFHQEGMYLPVGFMWQFYNFRIYSKK
ncbi:MAG: hypothetical protein FWD78_05955 [Treponema sp.]|nr:hypothetical protein [Treponema sp.]